MGDTEIEEDTTVSANVGDRIRQHSNTTDVPDRVGTIVAVLGDADAPLYRVRSESGEETVVAPGPDAVIEPASVGERLEQTGEQIAEKAGEVAGAARDKGVEAAGGVARTVADVADSVARRFEG
jgi:hypothetical protein